jgi:TfoX/Sxy family transcriptional regulator of competence genes
MAFDVTLAGRIRDRLRGAAGVTEKKMFGGLVFLTGGAMTVGVYGDDLLVRVDPAAVGAALAEPGVRRFTMGSRPTKGFVVVAGEAVDDAALDHWIARASAYVAALAKK